MRLPIAPGDSVRIEEVGASAWASVVEVLSTGDLVVEPVREHAEKLLVRGALSRDVHGYVIAVTRLEPWSQSRGTRAQTPAVLAAARRVRS